MASRGVTCPECGGTLGPAPPRAAVAANGAHGETSGRTDPPSFSLRDLAGDSPAAHEAPESRPAERLRFECENCHSVNTAAARMAGEAVRCPKCRKTTRVIPFTVAARTSVASEAEASAAGSPGAGRVSLAKIASAAETKHDTEQKLRWRSDQRVRREQPQVAASPPPVEPSALESPPGGVGGDDETRDKTSSLDESGPNPRPAANSPALEETPASCSAGEEADGASPREANPCKEDKREEIASSTEAARAVRERASEARRQAAAQVAAMELAVARAEELARRRIDSPGTRGALPPAPPARRAPLTLEQIDALERSSPCEESPHPADLVRRLGQGSFPRSRWRLSLPVLFSTPFRAFHNVGLGGATSRESARDPLVAIDAAVYANSPFRALGLPANASAEEIAARRNGGETKAQIGWAVTPWSVGYDQALHLVVDKARVDLVDDPAQRLVCELFWPHAASDGAWPLAQTGRLASWQVAQAFRRLTTGRSGRARALAAHGAAVAFHCLAISAECGYALGCAPWTDTYWRLAAEAWEEVLDSHEFWAYLVERGDPRINSGELVGRLRRGLPSLLLGFHALFAQAYARGGDDLACQRQLALGRFWPKSLAQFPHALTAAAVNSYR